MFETQELSLRVEAYFSDITTYAYLPLFIGPGPGSWNM